MTKIWLKVGRNSISWSIILKKMKKMWKRVSMNSWKKFMKKLNIMENNTCIMTWLLLSNKNLNLEGKNTEMVDINKIIIIIYKFISIYI